MQKWIVINIKDISDNVERFEELYCQRLQICICFKTTDEFWKPIFMAKILVTFYMKLTQLSIFTQPLRSGRICHKVNFLSGV